MKYLVLLTLLAGCDIYEIPFSSNFIGPKFKVGDCTMYKSDLTRNEFIDPEITIRKILKIGKNNYLYKFGNHAMLVNESNIFSFDLVSIKVDCPEGY